VCPIQDTGNRPPLVGRIFLHAHLLQPTLLMNVHEPFFSTLSDDELARIVSFIKSDTLLALLMSKQCTFAPVIRLLVSKLAFRRFVPNTFCFESSTLRVGSSTGSISSIKSVLEKCEGLRFTNVSIEINMNKSGTLNLGKLTKLFTSYMDAKSTSSLTIRGQNLDVVRFIDKNFTKTIKELSISAPPGERISSVGLNLRVLRYGGHNLSYIKDIWEILGATLEKVDLPSISDENTEWVESMKQMKDHCRNLNSIHLQHITIDFINEEGKGAYVDMICSFGSQLVQVDLVP